MASAKKLSIAEPKDFEGLTLMHMRVEGIKRIRLVDISLTDTVTTVGGSNAQGKSSLLDSYVMCVRGRTAMQMDPIAHGRQQGTAVCDFGDGQEVKLSVKRTIKRVGDTDFTADLELNIPGHVPPSRVEEFLKELTGTMAFDPMALDRMDDAERYEAIKKLVAGFDFAANSSARDAADRRRRDVNREQKREQTAAEAIAIDEKAPAEHVDEAELTAQLKAAGDRNLDIQQRATNRVNAEQAIAVAREVVAKTPAMIEQTRASLTAARDRETARIREQIEALQRQIAAREAECTAEIDHETTRLQTAATTAQTQADSLAAKLAAVEPLPAPVDTQALAAQLVTAQKTNRLLADWEGQRARKIAHQREADRLAGQSDELTATLTELDQARTAAIEAAQLPVDGLGFGAGYITLGGVPWRQASTGERTDASTAIAMALAPRLRVILIRNGSDLDSKTRERIRVRAAERGYRVLMEVVDDSGSTSVTLENGEVKAPASVAQAAEESAA
jgi:hypothetical protein